MECWGAQGGNIASGTYSIGGCGGYTSGVLASQPKARSFYVFVGKAGQINLLQRSFNGGGAPAASDDNCAQGGGATDIRITGGNWNDHASIITRIMVAGGGAGPERETAAGAAGGLSSYDSKNRSNNIATQTTGYRLGYGENADLNATASGAGGGYWGGVTGDGVGYISTSTTGSPGYLSSAGGSSFISGHNGCRSIKTATVKQRTILYNYSPHNSISEDYDDVTFNDNSVCTFNGISYQFNSTEMIDGRGYSWTTSKGAQKAMPKPTGGSYALGGGHTGNGYAKITSQ